MVETKTKNAIERKIKGGTNHREPASGRDSVSDRESGTEREEKQSQTSNYLAMKYLDLFDQLCHISVAVAVRAFHFIPLSLVS